MGSGAISASEDHTLKIWDLLSGREMFTLRGHSDEVKTVLITADGKRAISASWDHTLRVWDLPDGVAENCTAFRGIRLRSTPLR